MQHEIMIRQGEHWTTLKLNDRAQTDAQAKNNIRAGKWKNTNLSSNDKEFSFTSSNPDSFYWEWKQGDPGGIMYIGARSTSQSSHKEGEEPYFQILITLFSVKRLADGKFKVASASDVGEGKLTYPAAPLERGAIGWNMVRYER